MRIVCILLVLFVKTISSAQVIQKTEIDIEEFIQKFFPIPDDNDIKYEEVYETLFQYYRHPLNLNLATRTELQTLCLLSSLQVNNLLKHIKANGRLLTIYELQAVEGFDLETIQKILPFVNVKDRGVQSSASSLWKRIKREHEAHYLILRLDRVLETKKGYTLPIINRAGKLSSRYQGDPNRLFVRYRIRKSKDYSFGFTLEKDPGEQLTWDNKTKRYGMDYISFHGFLENQGNFKKIVIGDYNLQFGQGLLLSAGFGFGKGSETVQTIRKSNVGLRPYTASLEEGFMRGIATTYAIKNFEFTGFYSNKRRDARIISENDSLIEKEYYVEAIRSTGFHRTKAEIEAKSSIREQIVGTNFLYKHKNQHLTLGTTFLYTNYSLPLQRRQRFYNKFEFSGNENYNLGVHLNYSWQNFSFFGEVAKSKSGGVGGIGGFVASLAPNVETGFLIRHYDKNFHSFYGSAISEGSRNINEQGIYWGIKIRPMPKFQLNIYFDSFKFPWLKFGLYAPSSNGYECLSRLQYKLSKKIILDCQYRQEAKSKNNSTKISNLYTLIHTLKRNYMLQLNITTDKHIRFKTRLQGSSYKEEAKPLTYGIALIQDIGFSFWRIKVDARFALFDTDDYSSRQYVYEKDVLWTFSIPAYFGKGFRNYFLFRYQLNKRVNFWLRYAYSRFQNQEKISSGLEEIKGDKKSQLKLQMRVKF